MSRHIRRQLLLPATAAVLLRHRQDGNGDPHCRHDQAGNDGIRKERDRGRYQCDANLHDRFEPSQEELAAQAGLTKARISDLENGKINNPQAKTVDFLCVALNISRDERAACHQRHSPALPPLLLENLALRFGHGNPDALEGDLVAFLNEQAVAFGQMKERLAAIDSAGSAVARLVKEASDALDVGNFALADGRLAQAEEAQLLATTLPALEAQHRLRFERGYTSLLAGSVDDAAAHWETAANYFHPFDTTLEADRRYDATVLLREHAYRFRDAQALIAAERALRKNLELWSEPGRLQHWCKAMNALGGIYWRLSQFGCPDVRMISWRT